MIDQKILDRLTRVLRDVFDDDNLVAEPGLTARGVEGWDSLGNVRLFLAIEREFGLQFTAIEIISMKNIGQLAELIERKKGSAEL